MNSLVPFRLRLAGTRVQAVDKTIDQVEQSLYESPRQLQGAVDGIIVASQNVKESIQIDGKLGGIVVYIGSGLEDGIDSIDGFWAKTKRNEESPEVNKTVQYVCDNLQERV